MHYNNEKNDASENGTCLAKGTLNSDADDSEVSFLHMFITEPKGKLLTALPLV